MARSSGLEGGSCTDARARAAARFTRKRRPGNARFDRCTF